MKKMVCSLDPTATVTVENTNKITRDAKRRKIINKREKKIYKMIYDKRIVKKDFTTLPYGF